MRSRKAKEIERIQSMQAKTLESNGDDYIVGIYNGLEMALAVLLNREPVFISKLNETQVIDKTDDEEEKIGRTVFSGVRKVGANHESA